MTEQVTLINDIQIAADKDVDDPYYDLGFIEDLENCCLKNNHHNFQPSSSNSSKLNQSINGNSFNRKKDSNWCLNKTPSNDVTILTTHQRTIYTAGRPPWYDAQGQSFEPFVIGICGGSASGKTTVATKIIEALDVPWVTLLSLDSFYKVLNEEESKLASANEYNFDHPDAFDFKLIIETLQKLKVGKRVDVPIYNFVTHSREKRKRIMYGANVIILEGILIFYSKQLLDMIDMKVFIDTDPDIRLARRLKRDICERGRDLEGVIKQYNKFVKPSFDYYIAPSVRDADLIVPRGGQNQVAIDLIVQHVHKQLQLRGIQLRSKLLKSHIDQPLPETLKILPTNQQIEGIHVSFRQADVSKNELIHSSITLMRLLIEFAFSLSPFKINQGDFLRGHDKRGDNFKFCGVSIIRSAETMEQALCDVLEDVKLGKILIKTNQVTEEPELYYLRLPKDIEDYRIIVMDSTVTSGSAAMMAIRILLDHDVLEENIIFCSLLMTASGIHSIAYAFPKVKIFTTAVDLEIIEKKSSHIKNDFCK